MNDVIKRSDAGVRDISTKHSPAREPNLQPLNHRLASPSLLLRTIVLVLMLRYGIGKSSITATFVPRFALNCVSISVWTRSHVCHSTLQNSKFTTMPKRKSSAALAQPTTSSEMPPLLAATDHGPPMPKRRASARRVSQTKASMNPDQNANVLDHPQAFRASPDSDSNGDRMDLDAVINVEQQVKDEDQDDSVPSLITHGESDSTLSDISEMESPTKAKAPPARASEKGGKAKAKSAGPARLKKEDAKQPQFLDPEADGVEEADEEEIKEALSRPPPVNSDYLPLPWKGRRLGYVSRPKTSSP